MIEGANELVNGIKDGKPDKIFFGAKRIISEGTIGLDELEEFIFTYTEDLDIDIEGQELIKAGFHEIKDELIDQFQRKTVKESLSMAEEFFFKSLSVKITFSDYREQLNSIYMEHLSNINNSYSLEQIYGQCGKVYRDICNLNVSTGLWPRKEEYDNFLTYVIAGWVKDNLNNEQISRFDQESIARGIASSIYTWVQGENPSTA